MSESALVLVTTSFPIAADGSEAAGSFVGDFALELARSVPIRVVAPGNSSAHERWSQGVDVFRYEAPAKPLSTLTIRHLADIGRVLRAGASATREAVHSGPAHHVLALWALPSGDWARRATRGTRIPYSVWTLGSDIWTLGRIPVLRGYLRGVLRNAHACFSDGVKLAEDTRRIGGRDVTFLPSTRRVEGKRSTALKLEPPYRLLFLGRWHRNKGVDLLLDAFDLLDRRDWKRIEEVEICGGGPMEPMVKARVELLRSQGRPVCVRGYLDKAAAEQAILRADYLLIPSRIESIPVVFSDAMKLGCPVVCMPTGDLPDLVAAESCCGMMADSISAEGFARALSEALGRSAATFSQGVAICAARFDLATAARRVLEDLGAHADG